MLAILLYIQILDTCFHVQVAQPPGCYRGVRGWNHGGLVVSTWRMGHDVQFPAVRIESSDIWLLYMLDVSLIPLRGGVHHNYTRG